LTLSEAGVEWPWVVWTLQFTTYMEGLMSGRFQFIANDIDGNEEVKDKDRESLASIHHLFKGQSTKSWFWKGPERSPDCEGKTLQIR